ncbi:TetR/AcrR family transcriptional regulator [Gulosibacter sp. 10]|uniref:TetR/AcrR family transcriptional regulator n=1 Tax=Gulosibacter sp. 10 TaxID=1255570 RepID=UPI00097F35AB|nr:TetR/AcrR family transcriptional regulator [Gulosibacter sp. 10]SJM65189.1 hypothetical protein FM112_10725 [Gulosibacter sp. 10]
MTPSAAGPGTGGVPLSLRERQLQRTREDLIRATIDVIAEVGLEQATVQRITARAGTSRATLYAHFPDGRDDLYAQAYRALGRGLIQRSEQLASECETSVDRLCAYTQAMIELAAQRQLGLFYNVSGPRLAGMKFRGSGSQRTLDAFIVELKGAQERGEIAESLDIEAVSALLVGAIRETGIDTARNPSVARRSLAAFRQLIEALWNR